MIIIAMLVGIFSGIRTEIVPDATLPPIVDFLPRWHWAIWLSIALGIILLAMLEGVYRLRVIQIRGNWVERYIFENGKPPALPLCLLPLARIYSSGEPISKQLQLIRPGAQLYWKVLLPSERRQLRELWEWLGQDADDNEENIRRTSPSKPPFTLTRKNKQGDYQR